MKTIDAEFKSIPKMPSISISKEVTAAEFVKIIRSCDPKVAVTEIHLPRLGSKTFGKFIVHYKTQSKVNEPFCDTARRKEVSRD